jgi:hypothetical protein
MALRFGPALLPLVSEKFRCKLLPVGEDGRKVLGEVPDLAPLLVPPPVTFTMTSGV